jgi:hypothetical protein
MNGSTNVSPHTAPPAKKGGYGTLALVLALLLVAICGGGYLFVRMTLAESARDKAVLEKQFVEARAAVSAVDADYKARLAACTTQSRTCSADLDTCRRSMQQMVATSPSPAPGPM